MSVSGRCRRHGYSPAVNEPSLGARLGALWRSHGRRLLRYSAVSVFNVVFGQSLLVLAFSGFRWSHTASNVFAVAVSAGPAYFLSRKYVWEKQGSHHLTREVIPFWALAFAGLLLSTASAWLVGRWSHRQILLNLANLASFGFVWLFKFVVLDRYLFGGERLTDDPLDALVDDLLGSDER